MRKVFVKRDRNAHKKIWHKWFAWRPVIKNFWCRQQGMELIWWELVERKLTHSGGGACGNYWFWDYRDLRQNDK